MNHLSRRGKLLKFSGTTLFFLGGLLLFGNWLSSIEVPSVTSQRTDVQTAPPPPPAPPPVTLNDAKKAIPGVLKDIYAALNQGNPQIVKQSLHVQFFKDSQGLDYLCQPFSYRAHYIDSIVERPNKRFRARVRTLFKPLHEKAYMMYFGIWKGHFYLHRAVDDPLAMEKKLAVHTTRQFIFATKVWKWDVVRRFSQLDPTALRTERWEKLFRSIEQPKFDDGRLVSQNGLKFKITVRSTKSVFSRLYVLVDPSGDPKVVEIISGGYPKWRLVDPNLEQYTLTRFGLEPEPPRREQKQSYFARERP